MQALKIRFIAIAASALNEVSEPERAALRAALAGASQVAQVWVLGDAAAPLDQWAYPAQDCDPLRTLRELQTKHGHRPEHTIVIGASAEDLPMAERAGLYLHVGPEAALRRQVRRVVPMWGQYATGVINALTYFSECDFEDNAVVHEDIVDFVRRSIRFYESPDAAAASIRRFRSLCSELLSHFGDHISGIFATGFPFYCSKGTLEHGNTATPASILRYLREQQTYFASKLLDQRHFEEHAAKVFDHETAKRELGIRLDRNAFDVYEYESRGKSPPPVSESAPLAELLGDTAFGVRQDLWPCLYCVTLQAPDILPRQRVLKDTNETCLQCRQTALMLRNVSGCSVDMDMVIAVRRDARDAAMAIKRYILGCSDAYLYDLDLRRTITKYNDGPVDLFVTTASDLMVALQAMASPTWLATEFPAVALWSLTLPDHRFNLGEDFPVAFDPQTPLCPLLDEAFAAARRAFAEANSVESVVEALRAHSLARRQLMSNSDVVDSLAERLRHWRSDDSA